MDKQKYQKKKEKGNKVTGNKDRSINNDEEKSHNIALFNDLSLFMNKTISISVYGGECVTGKLIGFDEIANCILEADSSKKIVVLGKSITGIYEPGTLAI